MSVAIYLDTENWVGGGANLDPKKAKEAVRGFLSELKQLNLMPDSITVKRAYANWGDGRLRDIRRALQASGFRCDTLPLGAHRNVKNLLDIQLALDAAQLLFQQGKVEHFIIGSGDGGFYSLATLLREHQKRVTFIGRKGSCSSLLTNSGAELIEVSLELPAVGENVSQSARPLAPVPQNLNECLREAWNVLQEYAPAGEKSGGPFSIHQVAQKLMPRFPGYRPENFGFSKASQVFLVAAWQKGWELVRVANNDQWRLQARSSAADNFEALASEELNRLLHNEHAYKRILARANPEFCFIGAEIIDELLQEERDERPQVGVSRFRLGLGNHVERRDRWLLHLVPLALAKSSFGQVEFLEGRQLSHVLVQLREKARKLVEARLARSQPEVLALLFPVPSNQTAVVARIPRGREALNRVLGRTSEMPALSTSDSQRSLT